MEDALPSSWAARRPAVVAPVSFMFERIQQSSASLSMRSSTGALTRSPRKPSSGKATASWPRMSWTSDVAISGQALSSPLGPTGMELTTRWKKIPTITARMMPMTTRMPPTMRHALRQPLPDFAGAGAHEAGGMPGPPGAAGPPVGAQPPGCWGGAPHWPWGGGVPAGGAPHCGGCCGCGACCGAPHCGGCCGCGACGAAGAFHWGAGWGAAWGAGDDHVPADGAEDHVPALGAAGAGAGSTGGGATGGTGGGVSSCGQGAPGSVPLPGCSFVIWPSRWCWRWIARPIIAPPRSCRHGALTTDGATVARLPADG